MKQAMYKKNKGCKRDNYCYCTVERAITMYIGAKEKGLILEKSQSKASNINPYLGTLIFFSPT